MPTFQDTFANADYLATQLGTEVEGGLLLPINNPGTVAEFNGTTSVIDVGSGSTIDNIFAGGGTIACWIYPYNDGENDLGWILSKDDNVAYVWQLRLQNESNGRVQLLFAHTFSGVDGVWATTAAKIPVYEWTHIAVVYNNASVSNDPTIYINGCPVLHITESTTPTGTADDDSSKGMHIGNAYDGSRTFNGYISDVRVWKAEALTLSQISGIALSNISAGTLDAHWPLNGNSNDISGNGNNGSDTDITYSTASYYFPISMATSTNVLSGLSSIDITNSKYTLNHKSGGSASKIQYSLNNTNWYNNLNVSCDNAGGYFFDGVDDSITFAATVANVMSATTGSISAWVCPMGDGASNITIWLIDGIVADSGGYVGIFWGTNGGVTGFHFYNYDGTTDTIAYPVSSLEYGQWFHLCWVHSGGTLYAYVDGTLIGSVASGNTAATTGTIRFGRNYTAGSSFFPGRVDDVRIYSVDLSASQVWNLYSENTDAYTSNTQRKLWAKLDGNANDSSGNGYNGTVNGATSLTDWYNLPFFGTPAIDDVDLPYFDGINDKISCGSDSTINDIFSGGGTIMGWIFPIIDGGVSGITWIDKLETNAGWTIRSVDNTALRFYTYFSGTDGDWRSPAGSVPLRQWTHIAITWDSDSLTAPVMYINGISRTVSATLTPTGTYQSDAANTLQFGTSTVAGTLWAKGFLANVGFFNAALNAADVLSHFNLGYINTGHANYVDSWKLTEGSGHPTSSQGLATTLSGASWVKDIHRPQAAIAQQTNNIETLNGTNTVYVRSLFDVCPRQPVSYTEQSILYTDVYLLGGFSMGLHKIRAGHINDYSPSVAATVGIHSIEDGIIAPDASL